MAYIEKGERFGRLVALEAARTSRDVIQVQCDCGTIKTISVLANLRSGNTKSCGCKRLEILREYGWNSRKHGLSKHPYYGVWAAMISRCTRRDDPFYPDYGGRGITVCERWSDPRTGLQAFIDDMGDRPNGYTLERLDNEQGYSPDNCVWASFEDQASNRRTIIRHREHTALLKENQALKAQNELLRRRITDLIDSVSIARRGVV